MTETILQKIYRGIRDVLVFREAELPTQFVLDEFKPYDTKPEQEHRYGKLRESRREFEVLLRAARRLVKVMEDSKTALAEKDNKRLRELAFELEAIERQHEDLNAIFLSYESSKENFDKRLISASLEENVKTIDEIYGRPENKDVVVRKLEIRGSKQRKAMLVYLEGMVDKLLINQSILQPLMYFSGMGDAAEGEIFAILSSEYLPSNQTAQVKQFVDCAKGINAGDAALFVEGVGAALLVDVKGYKQRSLDRPQIEQTIQGAQVAFSEGLRVNTGLMRSILQTSDLVTDIFDIGTRIPKRCAVMYLRSLTNPALVAEVKRRIEGISTDYIVNMGVLEQFIEDHPTIPLPQMLSTERPDRVASSLAEGRMALFLDGTPFGYILPISLFSFFHSGEDWSLKASAGTFMRIIRWFGTLFALILPSLYLGISYYHSEALPTELILALAAARESVPFPAFFEILMMEFSFELIREAGIRVPGVLGSTIGIVGAIILGQAAVSANLVSPIMVVIIAITGLASFAIPDYRIAFALRILRFAFLFLSATLGLVGLALGMLVLTVELCSMKSFGVPYMAPVGPKTIANYDVIKRGSVFQMERRPDELNTQDPTRQPAISRSWTQEKPIKKEDLS
ncbi:MAG: GerA spore germination protein [Anaerosporomusa subterranea]|jgi:spore germination protein KA|nr:GerA spore germination protein [Anaerosporomusa subterranea]